MSSLMFDVVGNVDVDLDDVDVDVAVAVSQEVGPLGDRAAPAQGLRGAAE